MTPEPRPHVMHVYSRLDVGGIEWILMRLLPALDRGRYRASVCLLKRPGALADTLRDRGVGVDFVHFKGRMHPGSLVRLARLFREAQVSIVHAHARAAMTSATLAARLARVPVVVGTIHTMNVASGRRRVMQERLLDRWRDAVVAVSDAVKADYCRTTGIAPDRCVTIYHGIDVEDFSPAPTPDAKRAARARLGLDPEDPVVITVGRLARYKAHEILIAAAPEIVRTVPRVRFLVVGGGEREAELRALVAELGLGGSFLLLGERSDLPELYRAADLFCLTSTYEGFSIAIVEALASGLPVVATDVGGNREAVEEGRSGFLVPAGDSPALARRVIELLGDPARRARMAESARGSAARFGIGPTVRATESLYDRLLAAKSR